MGFIVINYFPSYYVNWEIFRVLIISFIFLVAGEMLNSAFNIAFKTKLLLLLNLFTLICFLTLSAFLIVLDWLALLQYGFLITAVINYLIKMAFCVRIRPDLRISVFSSLYLSIPSSSIAVFFI